MAEIHIEAHSKEAIDEKNKAIIKFLTEAGLHLERVSKENLEDDPRRVDTGLLRNSITFALDGEAPAISQYRGSSVHGDTETTRKNKVAGKPAPPPRSGTYSGTTPEEQSGSRALYVGTNVEYSAYV